MALKYIRDNLKSLYWVLYLVLAALVLLVFFEWGGFDPSRSRGTDVAATVGTETISYADFQPTWSGV